MSQYIAAESIYHKIQFLTEIIIQWVKRINELAGSKVCSEIKNYHTSHFTWVKHWAYPALGSDSFCSGVTEVTRRKDASAGGKMALHPVQQHRNPAGISRSHNPLWNLLSRNTTISLLTADNCMVSIDPTMPANTERWALLPPAPPGQAQPQGKGGAACRRFLCAVGGGQREGMAEMCVGLWHEWWLGRFLVFYKTFTC